jgi:hypothetical protein
MQARCKLTLGAWCKRSRWSLARGENCIKKVRHITNDQKNELSASSCNLHKVAYFLLCVTDTQGHRSNASSA